MLLLLLLLLLLCSVQRIHSSRQFFYPHTNQLIIHFQFRFTTSASIVNDNV